MYRYIDTLRFKLDSLDVNRRSASDQYVEVYFALLQAFKFTIYKELGISTHISHYSLVVEGASFNTSLWYGFTDIRLCPLIVLGPSYVYRDEPGTYLFSPVVRGIWPYYHLMNGSEALIMSIRDGMRGMQIYTQCTTCKYSNHEAKYCGLGKEMQPKCNKYVSARVNSVS
jgi:hypothetical protein